MSSLGGGGAQKAQSGCCLPPVSLPPAPLPSQASLWPDTSKQALGHFMCPFIALNGEGLPAPALKGQRQEGCRPSGKCVCVGVGGGKGGGMRSWGSHLTPNSWVGLRLTLFPRFESCHGPGSRTLKPRLSSSHSG